MVLMQSSRGGMRSLPSSSGTVCVVSGEARERHVLSPGPELTLRSDPAPGPRLS